jgi:hypothetical protein
MSLLCSGCVCFGSGALPLEHTSKTRHHPYLQGSGCNTSQPMFASISTAPCPLLLVYDAADSGCNTCSYGQPCCMYVVDPASGAVNLMSSKPSVINECEPDQLVDYVSFGEIRLCNRARNAVCCPSALSGVQHT